MLQCTKAAASTLEGVREQNDLPDTFGVRLFAAPAPDGEVGLGIDFAPEPVEGDAVTEQHGTTFMLDPQISDQLAEMTLDVVPDPAEDGNGAPQLVLRSQETE